jgi:hypothetical protein
MKYEEHTHQDAYFFNELDSLKVNITRIASFLKQTLKHLYGEAPSNWLVTFTTIQPEERKNGQS